MTRDELLEHFRTSRADFQAAIAGLSDAQLIEPVIDGWSVKDHLLHIAAWDTMRADEVERISAGYASAMRMTAGQSDALNEILYPLRKDLPLAQARWEFEHSRARLLAAIEAATDRALDSSLYGEAPVSSTHESQHADWIRAWRSRG